MTKKKFISCLFVTISLLCGQSVLAQLSCPQENKSCPADSANGYDGVTYQNIPLGISFAKFKALALAGHHILLPNRVLEENGVQIVYKASDEWPLGAFKWKPDFCFVEDNGVYRLSTIRGTIKDFEVYKGIIEVLHNKYGNHRVRDSQMVWKIGLRNETAAMLDGVLPGWLYFHDVNLLKLGLARKQRNSPGL